MTLYELFGVDVLCHIEEETHGGVLEAWDLEHLAEDPVLDGFEDALFEAHGHVLVRKFRVAKKVDERVECWAVAELHVERTRLIFHSGGDENVAADLFEERFLDVVRAWSAEGCNGEDFVALEGPAARQSLLR